MSCPKNLFATLCSDKSAAVRLAAANNPNCSIAGLKVLAASEFYEYRRLAAKHKNCTRDLFEALANDHVPSVRQAVVENNDCPIGIRAPLFMTEKSRSKETVRNENKRIFDALSAKYFEEDIGLSKPFVQARKLHLDSLINDSDVDELGDGLVEACSLSAKDAESVYRHITGISGPLFSGGDGSSPDEAVVIQCSLTSVGQFAEQMWLTENVGIENADWVLKTRLHGHRPNGRAFETFVLTLSDGTVHSTHFDITQWYLKN